MVLGGLLKYADKCLVFIYLLIFFVVMLFLSCLMFTWCYRHSQHSDGTLVINNLTSDDSGIYTCTASGTEHVEQLQIQLRVSGL